MKPRVSVLIPCYNAGRYLAAALDSVLAQTYRDFEIIVVDDGSEDNSAAVAAGYPRVRYFHHEHSGISATRNLAVAKAEGELIAFLDADDLWVPEKLQKQVAYLDGHPDCKLIFALAGNFLDGDPQTMSQRQEQLLNANMDNYLASCCIRRELFDTYGGFREDYPYGEDTHWVTRLWAAGVNMKHCIPEELYLRRIHDSNISLSHRKVEQKEIMALMADAIRRARKENKRGTDAANR